MSYADGQVLIMEKGKGEKMMCQNVSLPEMNHLFAAK
jgi:hypothetical protein